MKKKVLITLCMVLAAIAIFCVVLFVFMLPTKEGGEEPVHTHRLQAIPHLAPTCTEEGNIAYWVCSECGKTFSDETGLHVVTDVTLPVVGHDFAQEWASDGEYHWHVCQNGCGEISEKAEHTWDEGVVTEQPTCAKQGAKTYTCTVCHATKTEEIEAAEHDFAQEWASDGEYHWHVCQNGCGEISGEAEHIWDEGVVTEPPTCAKQGTKTYTCTVCHATKTEEIEATEHDFAQEWASDGEYHWHVCQNGCGEISEKAEHVWDEGVVTEQPTCAKQGAKTYTCTVCHATKTEAIEVLEHSYAAEWCFDELVHWHAVTCGHLDAVREEAHTFNAEGVCTDCGYYAQSADLLEYVLVDNGTAYQVTGIPLETTGGISIPSRHQGLPVTSIGWSAFSDCRGLISITLPEGIKSIEPSTFLRCSGLTSVTIPDSVTTIGYFAFKECSSLTEINIPDGVTSIGEGAFAHCENLTSVSIPNSVTYLGDDVFFSCENLVSVNIPDGMTVIGDYAFSYCSRLNSITISDSVTTIGDYAFNWCHGLYSVTIGDSVNSIGVFAFYACFSLTEIIVSDSVTSIGDSAFSGCSSLETVYYEGTAEEWAAISVATGNEDFTSATVYYYSEDTPTESGNYWHYIDGEVYVWS